MSRPDLRSSVEQIEWPAVMTGMAAQLLALDAQLTETQFWEPGRLVSRQFAQIGSLARHAAAQIPFYRERFAAAGLDLSRELTEEAWRRLPVLTRPEVQRHASALHAASYPASHGGIVETTTSGSTGMPVRVRKTALESLFWNAAHLRELSWHRIDPSGAIARVRGMPPHFSPEQMQAVRSVEGLRLPDWGPPYNLLVSTGPMFVTDYKATVAAQAALLQRVKPDYVLINPSSLRLLAKHCLAENIRLPGVRAFWTSNEMLEPDVRALTREAFGVRIVDNYTSAECGYMAIQCPDAEHYHIQSEVALIEVLDAEARPCLPGQIGRVVVTPLHNYAMPLLRYAVGDEAEVGEPCRCGRSLPVLRRIVGRSMDYLRLAHGGKRRVNLSYTIASIGAIQEYQIAQTALDRVEVRLVVLRPLTEEEAGRLRALVANEVGEGIAVTLAFPPAIPRTEAGKLRVFVSEIS